MLITHFADHFATSKTERNYELAELAQLIARTHAAEKARLPWLKGARFGDVRSERGSLRHDLNVVQVTAVEGDYDGEAMQFDQAWERLALLGVEAVLYTSPSHTPEKPRWRVVCPLSRPYPPAERAKFASWINGLLGGVLADESFSLSQSYYFGHLDGCAEFRVEHIRGTPLDELEELAQIAIARRSTSNGGQGGPTGSAGAFNEAELVAQITSGAAFHRPAIRLVGKWARDGMPMLDAKRRLEGAFDLIPEGRRDTRWRDRRGPDLARILDAIYGKEAVKPATTPWRGQCQVNAKGVPLGNLWNALLALRNDPAWAGKLRYDEMLQVEIGPRGPLEDTDLIPIHEWLQAHEFTRIGLDTVREAVQGVCHEHRFHPLRERLRELQWDGVRRIDGWLSRYLGTSPGEATAAIGRMFLVSMVARVFEPGCKADHMLVLEGPQRTLKSSVCEALAEPYFSDTLPDLSTDPIRVSMHLRGKWLIEVSELSSFNKADAAKLKAFLTTKVEQYIPKFAHHEVRQPRSCLFVGTTNDDTYLRDPTGGRRFWPVKCGTIDLEGLRLDRDLLLAEAVEAYLAGAEWWPDPAFEDHHLKPLQDSRYEGDGWEEPIERALRERTRITLHEIARDVLDLPQTQIGTVATRRITAILRQLGWVQTRTLRERFWQRPMTP